MATPLLRLLLLTFMSISMQAQVTNTMHTQAGSFDIPINHGALNQNSWDRIGSIDGSKYLLIQFESLPDQTRLEILNQRSIELLTYLPGYIYYCRVPQQFEASRFSGIGATSVWSPSPQQKLHKKIQINDVPPFAINGDLHRYMLTLYPDIQANGILQNLQQNGAVILDVYNQQHISFELTPSAIHQIAALPYVQFIDFINAPLTKENLVNLTDHRSNPLNTDYGAGRHYDGTGVRVALTDDGFIGPHIDYTGRTTQTAVLTINNGDHGDHCAGTIMSAGNLDPNGRGMAPGCDLWVYQATSSNNYILDDSLYTAPSTSIDIVSTSYSDGCNTGYNAGAESADRQIRTYKNVMRIFSAGNNGTSNCSYGAGANWGNITGGIKSAKNLIAVSNLSYIDVLQNSSSRGPATDGRIKPEVSAVGTDVYSTIDPNDYDLKTGTSMSCPGVSGVFTQLYQAYRELNGGQDPNTGLLKNVLMNACDDIGNPGPDFKHGYGRVNGLRAVKILEGAQYMHDSVSTGGTKTFTLNIPSNLQRVKIMLNWLDREAAVNAVTALVNDLDMVITDPSSDVFLPWVLNHAPNATTLNANAIRAVDHLNNAEQVTIDNPLAGTYTIQVAGFAVPFGPQDFFITYEFIENDELEVTYPIGGEGFKPGEIQTLRWDAISNGNTFAISYSTDNGSSWTSIMSSVAATATHYNWTIPNALSGTCKIKVSRNGVEAVSPSTFSIINVPANLNIARVCPDTVTITWSPVAGATSYDVFQLGAKYMDSIGTTSDTFFHATGLSILQENWFSVRAANTSLQAKGRRAFAIRQAPGLANCILQQDAINAGSTQPGNMTILNCAPASNFPVTFTVQNNGTQAITSIDLSYQLNGLTPVTETYTGGIAPGAIYMHTFTTPLSGIPAGNNQLRIWTALSGDQYLLNDTMMYSIAVANSNVAPLPWKEDFQSMSLCNTVPACDLTTCTLSNGMTNETNGIMDNFDWKVFAGATSTTQTGPDADHTFGAASGKYVYLESSYCFNQAASLLTPCFTFGTAAKPYLTYWYHMYGNGMGELHVDAFVDGGWQIDIVPVVSGDQGNSWIKQTKDISAYNGKTVFFRFRGLTGGNQRSDMGLDDLQVVDSASSTGLTDISSGFAIYPNPTESYVEIDNQQGIDYTQLELLDASGRIVRKEQVYAARLHRLDLGSLSDGIYWMVLKNKDQIVHRQKLIKQ